METLPSLIGAPQGKTLFFSFSLFVVLFNKNMTESCSLVTSWVIFFLTHRNSHESFHTLNTKVLRCVHVHPVHKQYLLVAENKYVRRLEYVF